MSSPAGAAAPGPAVTFREASMSDVADVVGLVESAYRGDSSRAGWTTEADLLDGQRTDADGIAGIVGDPASVLLVSESAADGLLGCCHLERRGRRAYFGTFAVRPRLQGHGIGDRLLREAEGQAVRRFGATAMEMTVIAQRTDLLAWYGRRGYRPTGRTRPFPYGDVRFGIPLRPDLVFAVLRKPLAD